MPYVEKDNLFLSLPAVFRAYTDERRLSGVTYETYQQLRVCYGMGEPLTSPRRYNEPLFFPEEPFRLAASVANSIRSAQPDYLICCYDSYPMTNFVSAALYIQFTLGWKRTESFSIADMGIFAPLLALEWVRATRGEALLVCMEQVYDWIESCEGSRYPRADALAVLSVSVGRRGPWQVVAYEQRWVELEDSGGDPYRADSRLAVAACTLIDELLRSMQLPAQQVTVVVPGFSDCLTEAIRKRYPDVYQRRDRRNLATADCFYSWDELTTGQKTSKPYILFSLVDSRGSVGLLLLRETRPEPR